MRCADREGHTWLELRADMTARQRAEHAPVTKSDGSKVEVHLDSSYNAFQGPGGHAGYGG